MSSFEPHYQHRQSAHCESGVMASLLSHAGLPMSEPMAFGLASGLAFAYLPIVKLSGMPLIAYRTLPKSIIRRASRALGLRLQQMAMGEDAERIAQVRQPTLILWGARDRLSPPATGQDFARRIPDSQLVVLPGVGHMPQEEDPQRSLEAVKAFIGWR